MTDTQLLADRLAVSDVIVRYAACLDDRDFDRYRDCFTPDVELHGFTAAPIHGIDAWMDFVRHALDNFEATQHMLGPPRVELEGDRARMRTDLQAQHFFESPKGRIFSLWGTYRSDCTKKDGVWRFQRHTLVTRALRTSDAFQA